MHGKRIVKGGEMLRGLIGSAVLLVTCSIPVQADLLENLLNGQNPFPTGGTGAGGTSTTGSSSSGTNTGGTASGTGSGAGTGTGVTTGEGTNTSAEGEEKSQRFQELITIAKGELEPNNHLAVADPLSPGQPVKGQLFSIEDQDWYSINTTEPKAEVTIEMPSGLAAWNITIRDRSGNVLAAKNSSKSSDLVFSTTLEKPGKYYVVVSNLEDSREDYVLLVSGSNLANPGGRHPDPNFHDAETELNNALADANGIGSVVQLVGHLSTESDIDIYKLESQGDEILSVELCPGNAACANQIGEEGGPWVVYIFDGGKVSQEMLDEERPLFVCVGETTPTTILVHHLYLSLNDGVFSPALLGIIDPAFGVSKQVEVGLRNPGTYYLVVSSPLKRDEDGSVRIKEEVKCGKDAEGKDRTIKEEKIIVFPFSDDQYDLRVVQTKLTPSISPVQSASLEANRSTFMGDVMYIPVVEANGMEYSAELRMFKRSNEIMFELLRVDSLGPIQEVMDTQDLEREAGKASLEGDVVHIPTAEFNGHYYSGDLRMVKENGKLLFKLIRAQRLN
ncbi:MAG: hypothetical protein AXA67_03445 [Methylothermaceae bacteria B42]|nr:MAG: hypothetical protein AXA67_03445 [Methylothermaceae bacteria B42]